MTSHITIRDGHIHTDTDHAIATHLDPAPTWNQHLKIQDTIADLFNRPAPTTRPHIIEIPLDSFRGICHDITTHHK